MRRRMSLAGQLLAGQVVLILVVLITVTAASLALSESSFRRTEGNRVQAVAESVATDRLVRLGLSTETSRGVLPPEAEDVRARSGSSFVTVTLRDGTVVATQRAWEIDTRFPLEAAAAEAGRSWVGVVERDGARAVQAQVPVQDDEGRVIGFTIVGREYPTLIGRLVQSTPELAIYLVVASLLGVAGSVLLARRIKRQTLGLEPRDIAGLVEHREALLHGIREGVLGLDLRDRVTVVNDEAAELLDLPPEAVNRTLDELDIHGRLRDVLTGHVQGTDQLVLVGGRVLTLNRMPVVTRGQVIGSVTTLRDRTELMRLQRELDLSRHTTDTLRAQTHEFTNRLHTIWGLLKLREHEEALRYVAAVQAAHSDLVRHVASRVRDPALIALLVAKASLAHEQGTELRVSDASRLDDVDERLSADLGTVVGNLVNNALDAVRSLLRACVEVEIVQDGGNVLVTVRDSGPGVPVDMTEDIFSLGVTTKADGTETRGVGLALTRMICRRRGGDVTVHNEDGAVFVARLPVDEAAVHA